MGTTMGPEYLGRMRARYRVATRPGKGRILDELCSVCGYHRKHAVRLLRGPANSSRRPRRGGRKVIYGVEETRALKAIWLATGQLCGKRLVKAVPLWLPHYESEHGVLENASRSRLLSMSASTMDRRLKACRVKPKHTRCTTRPGSLLRQQIPIRTHHWDADRPGYLEADSVSHGGTWTSGNYIWSLTFTDIWSGWTEQGAVWNRGAEGVLGVVGQVENRLGFPILGFDCDNGGEFLNFHLLHYFARRKKPVPFTRSRPYMSNDNAHVEQKQWTHVRQLLGYERLDDPALVKLINAVYEVWSRLSNFFLPTLKLKEKLRDGAHTCRRYEKACTPCQRLLDCPQIKRALKKRLREEYRSLNPFTLQRELEERLKPIHVWIAQRRRAGQGLSLSQNGPSDDLRQKAGPTSKAGPAAPSARPPSRRSGRSPAEPYPPNGRTSA